MCAGKLEEESGKRRASVWPWPQSLLLTAFLELALVACVLFLFNSGWGQCEEIRWRLENAEELHLVHSTRHCEYNNSRAETFKKEREKLEAVLEWTRWKRARDALNATHNGSKTKAEAAMEEEDEDLSRLGSEVINSWNWAKAIYAQSYALQPLIIFLCLVNLLLVWAGESRRGLWSLAGWASILLCIIGLGVNGVVGWVALEMSGVQKPLCNYLKKALGPNDLLATCESDSKNHNRMWVVGFAVSTYQCMALPLQTLAWWEWLRIARPSQEDDVTERETIDLLTTSTISLPLPKRQKQD